MVAIDEYESKAQLAAAFDATPSPGARNPGEIPTFPQPYDYDSSFQTHNYKTKTPKKGSRTLRALPPPFQDHLVLETESRVSGSFFD